MLPYAEDVVDIVILRCQHVQSFQRAHHIAMYWDIFVILTALSLTHKCVVCLNTALIQMSTVRPEAACLGGITGMMALA